MLFSQRLKELRIEKNLTQKELSLYLGLSANSICEWEKNRCEPSFDSLKKLSELFECSTDYLLGREDDFGNIAFTDEERALGLSDKHPVVLSDVDRYRLNILARAEDELGKPFVDGVIKMVELSIENKK